MRGGPDARNDDPVSAHDAVRLLARAGLSRLLLTALQVQGWQHLSPHGTEWWRGRGRIMPANALAIGATYCCVPIMIFGAGGVVDGAATCPSVSRGFSSVGASRDRRKLMFGYEFRKGLCRAGWGPRNFSARVVFRLGHTSLERSRTARKPPSLRPAPRPTRRGAGIMLHASLAHRLRFPTPTYCGSAPGSQPPHSTAASPETIHGHGTRNEINAHQGLCREREMSNRRATLNSGSPSRLRTPLPAAALSLDPRRD